MNILRLRCTFRLLSGAVLVAGIAGLGTGCNYGLTPDSSLPNFTDTNDVYSLNSGPLGSPTAIELFTGATLRADQAFQYDLAFDIDSVNQAILYPTARIATTLSSVRRIGIQLASGTYESITSAPRTGYAYDSTFHLAAGSIVTIESNDPAECGTSITGQTFYSKMQIVSVDSVAHKVHIIVTVDRNCGFHSLDPTAVPKN